MIHVLQTGNKPVYKGMCLTLLSILKYTKVPIHYHLMTIEVPWSNVPKISQEEANKLAEILKNANPLNEFSYYDISKDFIEQFEHTPNKDPMYTPASLIRLLSLNYIDTDYLIYLDADTLTYNSLEEFYKNDISNYEFACVKDYMGRFWIRHDYFNSGVMFLNCKLMKENRVFDKAIELLSKKKFFLADQTAIYKSSSKRLYLPFRYNEQRNVKDDTVVKHFCKGIKYFPIFKIYNIKQWHLKDMHNKLKMYMFDDIIEQYNNIFDDKITE